MAKHLLGLEHFSSINYIFIMRQRGSPFAWSLLGGLGVYALRRHFTRHSIVVLTYHRVLPDGDWSNRTRHPNVISTCEFDAHLRHLKAHYHVLSGRDFRKFVRGDSPAPMHSVLITFDDGYWDNYAHAFPILREHGLNAVFFISSNFIGASDNRLWFDQLDAILNAADAAAVSRWVSARNLGPQFSTRAELRNWLKRSTRADRDHILAQLSSAFGCDSTAAAQPMCWKNVVEMAQAGMTIGSHTATHQILSAASREEVRDELASSQAEIQRHIHDACWCFSYPNGEPPDFSALDAEELRLLGYECAFTQIAGFVTRASNRYGLPRMAVPAVAEIATFQSHVTGVYNWAQMARRVMATG